MSGIAEKLKGWVVPGLAAAGLADSSYLAILHLSGEIPPCGGYSGCAAVNSSPYAEVYGVPVAAFGAGAYALLLGLSLWRMRTSGRSKDRATAMLYSVAVAGGVFMVYLTGVEMFVLHDFCYWCLAVTAITLLLLGLVTLDFLATAQQGRHLKVVPAKHK